MKSLEQQFNENKPIYLQIKKKIEDQIVNDQLQEHEQIPSIREMVNFYQVNHLTISKGVNLLVDEGIIYKKRGLGMFVAEGAKEKLIQKRKKLFSNNFVQPLIKESNKLNISIEELIKIIKKTGSSPFPLV